MSQNNSELVVKVDETVKPTNQSNKRVWSKESDSYFLEDASEKKENLPIGVYRVQNSLRGLYLQNTSLEFTFDYKIYGMESKFIERVIRTYANSKGNMGVLLNGIKGTGWIKSIFIC